jgi:hypothetical protein
LNSELKGVHGLANELHCDITRGIAPNDFDERDAHFGSNQKAPPTRTGKFMI